MFGLLARKTVCFAYLDERDLARLRAAGCALLLLGNDRLQACLVIAHLFGSDLAAHHIDRRRTLNCFVSKNMRSARCDEKGKSLRR